MSNCKVSSGFTTSCADLLRVGGADKTFYIFYKSDLDTQISLAQTGDISSLDFGSYAGLRKFDGNKFSHSFGDALQVASGGTKSYKHTLSIKLSPNSTADDVKLQDLNLGTDIIALIPDNNQKFFILGAGNGLTVVSDDQNSGDAGDSDTRDVIVMEGSEITKKLRFALGGGYQATLDYINSLVITEA
jgi:hypothetical protein